MKKSIFTLMALMATAVCGLTSCNDSDDDYAAPAGAPAGAAVAAPTEDSLDGYTITVNYGGMEITYVFANGNVTEGGSTMPYTYNHVTGALEMDDQVQQVTIKAKLDFTANTWTDDMGPGGLSYTMTYTKA